MKNKLFGLLAALMLSGISINAEEPNMIKVVMLDGQEKVQALSVIGRIEFNADSLFLVASDGLILGREHKDHVQKIMFCYEDTPSSVSTVDVNGRIQIYPNPVQHLLVVKGATAGETMRIYSLSGNLVSTVKVVDENTTVDVSGLPVGQYLLQINTNIMKLIKQ